VREGADRHLVVTKIWSPANTKLNESATLMQLLTTFDRLAERQRANQQEE
jgi:hypothetical protein